MSPGSVELIIVSLLKLADIVLLLAENNNEVKQRSADLFAKLKDFAEQGRDPTREEIYELMGEKADLLSSLEKRAAEASHQAEQSPQESQAQVD